MKRFRQTYQIDHDKLEKTLKRLEATRGNTVDDVDDLPDSLPLDGTTVIFFGPSKKRRKNLQRREWRKPWMADVKQQSGACR